MVNQVKVLFGATFREVTGKKEMVKEVSSNSTLGDLLGELAKEYGRDFNAIIDSKTGEIGLDTLITVNGKNTRKTNIKLQEGDIVMITVPVGGG